MDVTPKEVTPGQKKKKHLTIYSWHVSNVTALECIVFEQGLWQS